MIKATDPSRFSARVFGLLAETMTPEQLRKASEKLRALGGDATEKAYFAATAKNLDEYTKAVDA